MKEFLLNNLAVKALSCAMCVSGAFNYAGITGFLFALPFAIHLVWSWKSKGAVFLTICGLIYFTGFHNPVLHPIISGGEVIILKDCWAMKGEEMTTYFSDEPTTERNIESVHLKKGDQFKVTKVFSLDYWQINLFVEAESLGTVSDAKTDGGEYYEFNKPIESVSLEHLSVMMYYPWIPLILFSELSKLAQ